MSGQNWMRAWRGRTVGQKWSWRCSRQRLTIVYWAMIITMSRCLARASAQPSP
jgi:hypothetical protein